MERVRTEQALDVEPVDRAVAFPAEDESFLGEVLRRAAAQAEEERRRQVEEEARKQAERERQLRSRPRPPAGFD